MASITESASLNRVAEVQLHMVSLKPDQTPILDRDIIDLRRETLPPTPISKNGKTRNGTKPNAPVDNRSDDIVNSGTAVSKQLSSIDLEKISSLISESKGSRSRNEQFDAEELYMREVRKIPLLTRAEELEVAIRIDRARKKHRRSLLGTDMMLKKAVEILTRVGAGDLAPDRTLDCKASSKEERAIVRMKIATNLPTLNHLLEQNELDFKVITSRASSDEQRLNAFRRMESRRAKAVRLVEDLRPKDKHFAITQKELRSMAERMSYLRSELKLARKRGQEDQIKISAMRRELHKLLKDSLEVPLVLRRKLDASQVDRQQLKENVDTLVTRNLRLAADFARKYQCSGYGFFDCVQDANIGLMRSVDKFEYRRGYKFSTYASWWIKQSLSRGVADNSETIRVPAYMRDARIKVNSAAEEVFKTTGRYATDAQLAAITGFSLKDIKEIKGCPRKPSPLQSNKGGVDGYNLGEVLQSLSGDEAEQSVERAILSEQLAEAMEILTPREADMLKKLNGIGLDYGKRLTLEEIGKEYEVTRERVRQITAKAVEKIRGSNELMRKLGPFMPRSTRLPRESL